MNKEAKINQHLKNIEAYAKLLTWAAKEKTFDKVTKK